jgi:hypothetical protein
MLFDLQSPRRRRVIRITFGALAAVFAISFVFLGVGTGGGGFSFSDLFGNGGSSDASSAFDDDINAAQDKLAANPNDTVALGQLVQLHYQAGSQDVNSDGTLTSDGEQQLREGADAWNKYVKLSKGNINPTAALFALNTFDQLGGIDFEKARSDTSTADALTDVNAAVDDWKTAGEAQQVLITARPNTANGNTYLRLASYLYLSGQTPAADQAVAQAKSAKGGAPDAEAQLQQIKTLGQDLQAAIKQLTKQQQSQGGGATGGGANGGGATGGSNPLNGLGTGGVGGSGTGF